MASLSFDSIFYDSPLTFFRVWNESHTNRNKNNPMTSYIASNYLTDELLKSSLLTTQDKNNVKLRYAKNCLLATFVFFKRMIMTPSKNILNDYFQFLNLSIKTILTF